MLKIWIGLMALSSFMIFEHSQELSQIGNNSGIQVLLDGYLKNQSLALNKSDYGHLINYRETTVETNCDQNDCSFSDDIYPTLKAFCVNCHNSKFAMGTVNLEGYQNILLYVQDSTLIRSIRQDVEVPIMPPTGIKIPDCNIVQIQN
ncbi:MAG: hypothetical protein NXI23_18115 [Bacteroidetes bacterium]|jgi:hypothetical protein|nr:hypothetical protein [Bacteroidota bacterium]